MIDFKLYLQQERMKSVEVLKQFLKTRRAYRKIDLSFKVYFDNLSTYLLAGGKMARPVLARLAYDLLGGKERERVILGSLATEVFHRFILTHDDLIDRDLTRHGQPTLEKIYQEELNTMKVTKPMATYALGMAMESGDLIHALTYELILESGFPGEIAVQVIRGFIQCTFETVAGWRLESMIKQRAINEVNLTQVRKVMTLVSAQYSVVWPLRIGELFAGVENGAWNETVESFGLNVGLAFQIQDDVLGIFGDPKITGKPVGGDLREGKKSYVLMRGYKLANLKEKQILEEANGNETISQSEIERVRQILNRVGALDWALVQAQRLAKQGSKTLETIRNQQNGEIIDRLQQLGEFLAKRDF